MNEDEAMSFFDSPQFRDFLEEGSDYASALFPDRPYTGQMHTDTGERGKTELRGITLRDVADCYIIGAFEASGLQAEDYPKTIFELPWENMDPKAVSQCQSVALEQRMGIFPNVPPIHRADEEPETDEARARRYMSAMERMYQMVESMDVSGSVVNEALRDGVGEIFWSEK